MKRILLTTVLLLSFLFQGNAQRFDYENTSKLFFGINVGRTWHTSDVENVKKRFPLGAGFVFGGSINQDYGKAVSFDIRLRYLGGNWYGQDSDTTGAIANNAAVNALYDTLGYTVQNFKATQHRLSLELSIHANRFKEKTGFDPYIFAGIGVTGTRTKGDLLQKTGNLSDGVIYPYNESPSGNIIDKDYTVALDKNESGEAYENERFEANILPSLGFGIGYYFNSRFSIGLEHKSTFFLADYFDGTTLNQDGMPSDNFTNDIYHYSGIYLKWYFKTSNNNDRVSPQDDAYIPPTKPIDPIVENDPATNEPNRKRPPIVTFNNPASTPFKTNNPTFAIRANVQYVNSANDLTFTRNGANYSTFIFNPMNRLFESNVNLDIGENIFELTGVNADGSDSDRVVIIYERQVEDRTNPPVVNIVDPAIRPHTINQLNYIVKADIQNIKARNQLAVTFNESAFTDFSFSANGNINFNANLSLKAGVNTFKIVGTNEAGMDLDETVIIYTREANDNTGYPPTVRIITPNLNPYTTGQSTERVAAKIENVNSKQQIDIKVNGVSTTNFTYNVATKRVQIDASLVLGSNDITISAINPYGNDLDKIQIIYRRGGTDTGNIGTPPKVNILTPNNNPHTTDQANANIIAEVENIDTKSQVEVNVNGVPTTNFTFNNATKLVQLNTALIAGNNNVVIKATNAHGNDSDQTQIIYRRGGSDSDHSGEVPKVKIITPGDNPHSTTLSTANIFAEVLNVTNKSQVEVKINGSNTTNFIYNSMTNRVQFTTNLIIGNNTVIIKATNGYGTDSDNSQIIYRRGGNDSGNNGVPPTVKFLTPNTNPFTTEDFTTIVIAQVGNIDTQEQIEVKINGVVTTMFTFNNTSKLIQLEPKLSAGSNIISIKVTNSYGSDAADTQIIMKKKPAGKPPIVSFIAPNEEFRVVEIPDFKMIAKVENVTKKTDISLYFNGNLVNPNNYVFNPSMQTVHYESNLAFGLNTYVVNAKNNFGTHQATEKIERKTKVVNEVEEETVIIDIEPLPCDKPSMYLVSPTSDHTKTDNNSISVEGKIEHLDNSDGIMIYLNGEREYGFDFNETNMIFSHKLQLKEGENTYLISLINKCGSFEKELTFQYIAPQGCGINLDLGSIDSDFCLTTPSGSYTRSDLINNPDFQYKGIANSIYFKAGGDGKVTIGNTDYPLEKDYYYYFVRNITVDISRKKSNGDEQWNICITAERHPLFGKGSSKPKSPCEKTEDGSSNPDSLNGTPETQEKPETKEGPDVRQKPARNNENSKPNEELNKPVERNNENIRNPRGGR